MSKIIILYLTFYFFYFFYFCLKNMSQSAVSNQLESCTGKISVIIEALDMQGNRVKQYFRDNHNVMPKLDFVSMSHTFHYVKHFIPYIKVAHEYLSVAPTQSKNYGEELNFTIVSTADFIEDGYMRVKLPELSCLPVVLPPIIVMPDDDVYAANGNRPTNFGSGLLAIATEANKTLIHHGFSYQYVAGVPADTYVTLDGKKFALKVSDPPNGIAKGSIDYHYEDKSGNFLAGPNGLDSVPGPNGFGVVGNPVISQNDIKFAEYGAIKLFKDFRFVVDENEIEGYNSSHSMEMLKSMVVDNDREIYEELIGNGFYRDHVTHTGLSVKDKTISGGKSGLMGEDYSQKIVTSFRGLTVPKPLSPETEIILPLEFTFSKCHREAYPIACTPDAEIEIKVKTAPLEEIFYAKPAINIRETITLYPVDPAAPVVAPGGSIPVLAGTEKRPVEVFDRLIPTQIPGSTVGMPIDKTMKVDIVMRHTSLSNLHHLSLISHPYFSRIFIRNTFRNQIPAGAMESAPIDVVGAKLPIEYMFINDVCPRNFDEKNNPFVDSQWHQPGCLEPKTLEQYSHIRTDKVTGFVAGNVVTQKYLTHRQTDLTLEHKATPIITRIGFNLYDSTYFNERDAKFYRTYAPYLYKGFTSNPRKNKALPPLFISFAQSPHNPDLDGTIETTKNRKMTLLLTTNEYPRGVNPDGYSAVAGSNNLAIYQKLNLIHNVREINFIFIANNTAVIRYV